jgi:hypothetical protein
MISEIFFSKMAKMRFSDLKYCWFIQNLTDNRHFALKIDENR